MIRKKAIFDTNIWIDYWNSHGTAHRSLIESHDFERYLSAVTVKELRRGAHERTTMRAFDSQLRTFRSKGRVVVPSDRVFERTGFVLQEFQAAGWDVRLAALHNDILIALSARDVGATVYTKDHDFTAIKGIERFSLEIVD